MRLPVAAREIRVAAHDRASYRGRVWFAGAAILSTFWILYGALGFTGRLTTSAGAQIFALQAWAAYLFACCAFNATADSISREKRDGTLGLLFLTHLKGRDIVLGKLASGMTRHFAGALATLPVLTLPTLMGGIQLSQSIHLLLSVLNCMLFAASAGLLASTLTSDRNRSISIAICIVVIFAVFIPIFTFAARRNGLFLDLCSILDLFTPFYAQSVSQGAMLGFQKTFFYISLGIIFLISCSMLAIASCIAPHTWQIRDRRPIIERLRKTFVAWADQTIPSRSPLGRRLLDSNAYEWLAARRKSAANDTWIFLSLMLTIAIACTLNFTRHYDPASVLILTCIPAAFIIQVNYKFRIGGHACARFCEDRDTNALELILSTPMTLPKMITGEFRALRRHFLLPILLILPLLFLAWHLCLPGIGRISANFTNNSDASLFQTRGLYIALAIAIFLILDTIALAWMAIWSSLFLRRTDQARPFSMAVTLYAPIVLYGVGVSIVQNKIYFDYFNRVSYFWIVLPFCLVLFICDLALIYDCRRRLLNKAKKSTPAPEIHTREALSLAAIFASLKRPPRRAPIPLLIVILIVILFCLFPYSPPNT